MFDNKFYLKFSFILNYIKNIKFLFQIMNKKVNWMSGNDFEYKKSF